MNGFDANTSIIRDHEASNMRLGIIHTCHQDDVLSILGISVFRVLFSYGRLGFMQATSPRAIHGR